MRILGLHFDRPYYRWAVIEQSGKKFSIQSLKTLASGDDVKPLYIAERKDSVATGMKTLVRQLEFKFSSMRKIEQGLRFQIESLTHLKMEEMVYAEQIYQKEAGAGSTVFLAAKESLQTSLLQWNELGIHPDLMTGVPQALLQFTRYRCPQLESVFVVHLGSDEWTCVWIEEGKIKKSFSIEEGVESLLGSLWEDRKKVLFPSEVNGVAKQIDLLQLKSHLNPHLSENLKSLRCKLHATLFSFQQQAGQRPVFFTGRTDAFGQFTTFLLEDSKLAIYEPPIPLSLDESKCAVAIGSALEATARKKIQFLKDEFVPARQWRKAGAWGLGLIAGTVALNLLCICLGWHHFKQQRESVAASFKQIVEQMDKPLSESLFAEGIEAGIEQSAQVVQKYNKEALFLVQAPTVTEVLGWLRKVDSLEVLDFKYHLVSFPRIGGLRDPYQAKVEIEFRANAMSARTFHENLLKGETIADPNQEIVWETLTDSNRVSFYLKNRVPYVP
jgi:hypothetical protein